jgi:hypothetical protein
VLLEERDARRGLGRAGLPAQLHVRDAVETLLDDLLRGHAGRDVTGDRHAQLVRLIGDDRHERGRHDDVDLDLLETGVVIPAHSGARFIRRGHADAAERARARSVDEAGREETRPERASGDRILRRLQELELAAHVANRRDARREVGWEPVDLRHVGVHVPEARDDELPFRIDGGDAVRHRCRCAGPDGGDAAIADDDRRVLNRGPIGAVDDRRAGDGVGRRLQRPSVSGPRPQIVHAIFDGQWHPKAIVVLVPG